MIPKNPESHGQLNGEVDIVSNAAMVVEVDRQGDIFLQERFPEISDMPFKNLVDIEVVIKLLLRAVATMCRIKRTEIVICFTRASGVIIIIDVDAVPVIFDLII